LTAIEDRDSISTLGIPCHLEGNKTGFSWYSGVQRLRQQSCRSHECRKGKKLAAVQFSKGDHIL